MIVKCPTCKKNVEWKDSNPERPFCSTRCKLIDLGAWANEDYRIPAENAHPDDLDQIDHEAGNSDEDNPGATRLTH